MPMNDFEKKTDIVDTTDCLEAISVFKSMKNFLFLLIFIGLLLLQAIFWLNYLGFIDQTGCPTKTCSMVCDASGCLRLAPTALADAPLSNEPINPEKEPIATEQKPNIQATVDESSEQIMDQAKKAVDPTETQTSQSAAKPTPSKHKLSLGKYDKYLPRCNQVIWAIRICNFVVLMAMILYCLTLLVCVKISLAGRLGGLNHISRGFFRSLFALILLFPWQTYFPGILLGAMYLPTELLCCTTMNEGPILCQILYFLRFSGMWLLVFVLIFSAQIRSRRWSQATLRRLGILH
jgi:hypothetical protein